MSTQHTPGPWYKAIDYRARGAHYAIGTSPAWNSNPVALVMDMPEDSELANARLIAASPDLLTMLERVIAEYTQADPTDGPIALLTLEQARAAIAKAKGGAS